MSQTDSPALRTESEDPTDWAPVRHSRRTAGQGNPISVERVKQSPIVEELLLLKDRVTSSYYGHRNRVLFENVKTFCLFVGHARSGHSIIGALLDAHPNVVLADELHTLKYVSEGFSREQIFSLALLRSQKQFRKGRKKGGREGKVYSYLVPGQWQGRFDRLDVIGASKAGGSTRKFAEDPAILARLRDHLAGTDLKIVHVIRNPFDNISTMILRRGYTFEHTIQRYFSNCMTLTELRKRLDAGAYYAVRHEDVIEQPGPQLTQMCRFLGLAAPADYLSACSGILFKSPSKSRFKVEWSPKMIDLVQGKLEEFDYLDGYSYGT